MQKLYGQFYIDFQSLYLFRFDNRKIKTKQNKNRMPNQNLSSTHLYLKYIMGK